MICHIREGIPGAVYIGRASPRRGLPASIWGNPYKVSECGREAAVMMYAARILERPALVRALPSLRGKDLACWCRESSESSPRCHGDILVAMLDLFEDQALEEVVSLLGHPVIIMQRSGGTVRMLSFSDSLAMILNKAGLH
jgi:hypothetical protein